MTRKRTLGTRAALGGITAAAALIAAQPAAKADELTDLRANQELLQRRVDQLAQSGNVGAGPVLETTTGGPVNVQMTGGSFPRSFLSPGTDTSIRVGGEIRLDSLYYITGGNPNEQPQGTNAGTTGQLNNIPLKGSANRIRGEEVLTMSPQQSKISVETRTPTALGEARSFIEFDFAGNAPSGSRETSTSNSLTPRLRFAYGTLGPLLFGQANSNFNDSDASLETLDFGGLIGGGGPARVPQIRWTEPLDGWGLLGALSISAEAPETEIWTPPQSSQVNGVTVNSFGGVFGANGITDGVRGVGNPLKNTAPEMVAAWYIPQPWGHVDFAAVARPLLRVQTPFGKGIDRTFAGYGFSFSGDVKPRWFGWDKDYFIWSVIGGEAMGRYLYAGSGTSVGLVSNMTVDTLNAGTTTVKPTRGYAGRIGYQHQWSPEWRSNIGVGYYRLDIPGVGANTGALNKELTMGVANLIWAPIAFVDIGLEYVYGRRKVVSGASGDEHVIENRLRLRF
jgi:hypothetical protein